MASCKIQESKKKARRPIYCCHLVFLSSIFSADGTNFKEALDLSNGVFETSLEPPEGQNIDYINVLLTAD